MKAQLRADLLPHGKKILGTIGFIVNSVRSDAYFAYCVLASSYCNALHSSEYLFRLIICLGRYIAKTANLSLTLHSKPPSPAGVDRVGADLYRTNVDSSHGNALEGRSYGGFVVMCKGRRL